jgi:Lysine methyltransferase
MYIAEKKLMLARVIIVSRTIYTGGRSSSNCLGLALRADHHITERFCALQFCQLTYSLEGTYNNIDTIGKIILSMTTTNTTGNHGAVIGDRRRDIPWREYNIHTTRRNDGEDEDGDYDDGDDEAAEAQNFDLFAPADPFETVELRYCPGGTASSTADDDCDAGTSCTRNKNDSSSNSSQGCKIVIRAHREYTNSTGMAIWRGSEALCEYLVGTSSDSSSSGGQQPQQPRHVRLLQNKRVLELGAGVGLCGILAHILCGAAHVCITDGDLTVLDNLRHNVARNCPASFPACSSSAALVSSNNNNNKAEDYANDGAAVAAASTVSCPQLIWGHRLEEFAREHGRFQVILAADCVYMAKSVPLLWKTVDRLLQLDRDDGTDNCGGGAEDTGGDDDRPLFIYCNLSASQAPVQQVLAVGAAHGFTDVAQDPDDDWVYLIRSRRRRPAKAPAVAPSSTPRNGAV